ncbi:hypothetical protein QUF54_01175 [Candidatus Marithioploca araucensis]|uniref:Uncharacterized protein n=1 Tax=Candidatus Marithioploca araucensis TaxID=70273 RepID=A0ABT7VR04_9GAMM|nr:hypothetical protein [Candidatus Marithioploca araucensis]
MEYNASALSLGVQRFVLEYNVLALSLGVQRFVLEYNASALSWSTTLQFILAK